MAALVPVIVIGTEELLMWAAAAVGLTIVAFKSKERLDDVVARSPQNSSGSCPPHNFYNGKDLNYVAQELGMSRKELGAAIHREKSSIEGNPDVQFCLKCGGVFTKNGELVGHL
mmetsp:Transcript_51510/g.95292  ORF Transcript_51510/g.95292 Transcript_51510/m.95292 type:complete len:114 (-) Transcript_51510:312-653(-)